MDATFVLQAKGTLVIICDWIISCKLQLSIGANFIGHNTTLYTGK